MRVISVDPGFDRLGIAILDKEKQGAKEVLVYSDCFTTDKEQSYAERLNALVIEMEKLIEEHKPECFASEQLFFAKNQRTAIDVAGARGVLLQVAHKHNLPIFEYTPMQIKIAVAGVGSADKTQVTDMVKRLVKIEKEKGLDDEYDAIAVGITCLAHERF